MKRTSLITLSLLLLLQMSIPAIAGHPKSKKMKKGILLVTFGTSYSNAQQAFANIEEEVKKSFPDTEVRWAYTSVIIRRKLKIQGVEKDSPAMALAKMAEDGFTHVAIQSLAVIPGGEYISVKLTKHAFDKIPKGIKKLSMGFPLMYHNEDLEKVAQATHNNFKKDLKKYDAVIFMGHGTDKAANIYYPGFQYYLSTKSDKFVIGTVEGFPTFENAMTMLKKLKAKKVLLAPLMSVAGDHAQNDMASNEPDSWKSMLEKEGLKVTCLLKGMAEYDDIVSVWIEHLKKAYNDLDKK